MQYSPLRDMLLSGETHLINHHILFCLTGLPAPLCVVENVLLLGVWNPMNSISKINDVKPKSIQFSLGNKEILLFLVLTFSSASLKKKFLSSGFGILVQQQTHLMTCATYGADLCMSRTWWRELWAAFWQEFNKELASTSSRCPIPAMWMMCELLWFVVLHNHAWNRPVLV